MTRTQPSMPRLSFLETDEPAIDPTPERLRHANDNYLRVDGVVRVTDTPIDRMLKRGEITPAQHAAGEAYRSEWQAAGLSPLGAVDYGRVQVDGKTPISTSDFRMMARDRFNRSNRAMSTAEKAVVNSIVLHEQTLFTAGRMAGETTRAAPSVARALLLTGLTALAGAHGLGGRMNSPKNA